MTLPAYLPQQANIRAYYALENVNDGSANAYNLTNENTVTFSAAKILNGANFGATNSNKALSVGHVGITTGAITLLLLIKCLAEIGTGTWGISYQYGFSNPGVINDLNYEYNAGTRRIAAVREKYQSTVYTDYTNLTMGTSGFHQVGLIYDTAKIYSVVDGVISAGTSMTGGGSNLASESFGIARNYSSGNYASILADECVVWNVALTAAEILALYKSYSPPSGGGILNWYFS